MDHDDTTDDSTTSALKSDDDSYLVILYLLVFLFLLGVVGYGLCCGLPTLLARFCSCTTADRRCCGIPIIRCRFDTAAYRRERETLQRLRDIRAVQRQRQLHALQWASSQPGGAAAVDPALIRAMNATPNNIAVIAAAQQGTSGRGMISPWSPVEADLRRLAYLHAQPGGRATMTQQQQQQQPHPFADRASMWTAFHQLNSMGLIIVPQDQAEVEDGHFRETLSSDERKGVLEDILDFAPYHAKVQQNEGEKGDTESERRCNDTEESALERGGIESGEFDAASDCDVDAAGSSRTSIAFPAHETPKVPETTCAICLDEFEDGDMLNVQGLCPHLFHKDCLIMWLERHDACPICRREMVTDSQWREAHAHHGEAEASTGT